MPSRGPGVGCIDLRREVDKIKSFDKSVIRIEIDREGGKYQY